MPLRVEGGVLQARAEVSFIVAAVCSVWLALSSRSLAAQLSSDPHSLAADSRLIKATQWQYMMHPVVERH